MVELSYYFLMVFLEVLLFHFLCFLMDFCIQDVIQVSGEEEIFDGILVGDGIPRQIIYRTLEEEGLAETFFGHLFFRC